MKALPKWIILSLVGAILGVLVWFPMSGFSPSQGVSLMTFVGAISCALGGAGLVFCIDAIRTYKAFFIILAISTVIVAGLSTYALLNPPQQCTWQSTQQEIAASHCIIGADIGTGMVIFTLSFFWIVLMSSLGVIVTIRLHRRRKQQT